MFNNPEGVIQHISHKIKNSKVLVIGDIMLDRYCYGEVQRISPEAPVPIIHIQREHSALGGAGNVANNLAHLGCRVFLSGFTGDDEGRNCMLGLLEDAGIDYSGVFMSTKPTIIKMRVIGGHQQIVRLDREESYLPNQELLHQVSSWFLQCLNTVKPDVIVISDYGKGTCSPYLCEFVITAGKAERIPIIIDPKGIDWKKYSGATLLTPNLKELSELALKPIPNNDQNVEIQATLVRAQYNIDNLLVTRSEMGMSLVTEDDCIHIPTKAQEVFDVSGAGDTVVATLAAMLAGKQNLHDAMIVANIAAGFVVGKVGTYPIHLKELQESLYAMKHVGIDRKIVEIEQLTLIIEEWKKSGNKLVFTNGCFDILHVGHISYLEQAKSLGHKLIVGLNSDNSIKRLKGKTRPIINQINRAQLLAALEFVDAVIVFEEDTPEDLLSMLRPDILVKGGDYREEDILGREYVEEVRVLPFISGFSTSSIIEKILLVEEQNVLRMKL